VKIVRQATIVLSVIAWALVCGSSIAMAAQSLVPPHWNRYMLAGTQAAMRGDMDGAIRSWTRLYAIAQDSCERDWAQTQIRAARGARDDAKRKSMRPKRIYDDYQNRVVKVWSTSPCDRP
jgi:hypothetical protein